jgi:hypothetical protein
MESFKSILSNYESTNYISGLVSEVLEDEDLADIESSFIKDNIDGLNNDLRNCESVYDFNDILDNYRLEEYDIISEENDLIISKFREDIIPEFISLIKDLGLYKGLKAKIQEELELEKQQFRKVSANV